MKTQYRIHKYINCVHDKTVKNCGKKYDEIHDDPDFPDAPRLEIYMEAFGGLEDVTEKWYKENRA